MNHLWQRFLLASSLIVGLLIGVGVTVFGYSNLAKVDVHWSVLHLNGVPLWTVAVVPLALFLIAGTLYHWVDGLHHFTEHMRHRRRVHELETEVASLRAHLDQVLEMPDHSASKLPSRKASAVSLAAADEAMADLGASTTEPAPAEPPEDGVAVAEAGAGKKSRSGQRKRVTLEIASARELPAASEPQVEVPVGNGKPAEPGDGIEREA